MSAPIPYLFFNGDAAEAAKAYTRIFGGEVVSQMPMSEGPPDMGIPEERQDWIMHCEIRLGDGSLYLSDDFMANSPAMQGSSVMMDLATTAEAKAAFDALAEGGAVGMEFSPTFWSAGFGTVVDRFGIRWMIGSAEPLPDEAA